MADGAKDVRTIADALGLERLATWGISGGAPHALAAAALLPDRVSAAAVIAPPAPHDAEGLDVRAGLSPATLAELELALEGEEPLRAMLEQLRAAFLAATKEELVDILLAGFAEVDAEAIRADGGEYAYRQASDALGASVDGWVDDDLALVASWEFDPARIPQPVLLLHGRRDGIVPIAHSRWLSGRLPRAELRETDDGHLGIGLRIPEIHTWLLERSELGRA
jgi:pimeloyl-ACP methyl ester carboxylesterase